MLGSPPWGSSWSGVSSVTELVAVSALKFKSATRTLISTSSKPSDVFGKALHAPPSNPIRIVVGNAAHDLPKPPSIRLSQQRRRETGDRINQIIVAARGVINAIFTTACRATFEGGELRN